MNTKQMMSAIESLLFVSGDRLSLVRMTEILKTDAKSCRETVTLLAEDLENNSRGLRIREIDHGYQMYTAPENHDVIRHFREVKTSQGLSQACYEVLSVIAYKQPVTRIQIEKIRGTASDSALARLVEKGLIRPSGRLDAPGRPILYVTTPHFLQAFGFSSLRELPVIDLVDMPELTGETTGTREAGEAGET